MKPNLNTQADAVIRLFGDDRIEKDGWLFSYQALINLCEPHVNAAKIDRNYLIRLTSPKWFLSELYFLYKKKKMLPELSEKRKREIWAESKKDKLLYLALYVIEIV